MGLLRLTKRVNGVWELLKQAEPKDFTKYSSHFSELTFKQKLGRVGAMLEDTLLMPVLKLYYILKEPSVPKRSKLYIMGALGYFILPVDLLPDFLPGLLGFTDDIIVVGIILRQVRKFDSPQIQAKVDRLLRKICPMRETPQTDL
ncbi:YkvA family protein [uncultured Porphyromonas sp.]|uniref:YkvA family protein n=1 Tax=uncultured Porphyromonas sp. TaxID=159274 RepID=UPI0026180C9D|nr:YkvA family protein [uncultured Porphyromonas sp.]